MRGGLPVFLVVVLALVLASGCLRPAPSASNDLVSSKKYTHLYIEVDYQEGKKLNGGTLDLLKQRINDHLSKPAGTEVVETAFTASKTTWTTDDLRAEETQERQHQPEGTTMVLYILVVGGHHAEDTSDAKVLGIQYGRASIAIFKDTIQNTGLIPGFLSNAGDVEKAVVVHEFGHTAGLVNNGLAMQTPHEDSGHPHHSSNQNSVMYWAVENTLGIRGLSTIPNDFDSNDVADMRAAGGK